jgi:hypothetical protein
MKLFSASILASAASTVMGQATAPQNSNPTDLLSRWDMTTPNITYISDENKFILDFLTASTQNELTGMQEEFYDVNCKDDGSGFPEEVLTDIFFNPDPATPGRPMMGFNPVTLKPQLQFVIDTQKAAANPLIYEIVGEADVCAMGQNYDIYVEITVEVDKTNTQYTGDNRIEVIDEATNEIKFVFDDNQFVTGMNVIQIPNLCRGKDYLFNFTDTYLDGLTSYGPEGVVGTYDSSGTPDIIFQKAADEIGDGFTSLFNLPINPQNPATNVQGRDGQGMMKFCVRSVLGYGGNPDQNMSLEDQIYYNYKEVNFIESLITIFFDMSAGFKVLEFNVDPKERIETTQVKDSYDLEAWLCYANPTSEQMVSTPFPDNPNPNVINKIVPAEIDSAFFAATPTNPNPAPSFFNQGALITVCVAPDDAAWQDGIRMNGINYFDWARSDLDDTAAGLDDTSDITQEAIIVSTSTGEGVSAPNGLTSYTASTCVGGAHYCTFSSILFADFYVSRGVASGGGNANLIFAAIGSRRLGSPEDESTDRNRKLQEDEAADSPFDVSVPVDLTDTGPAGLKTAGGASYGITALASALALLGAALLA